MATSFDIDRASITDNDAERQVEFTAEIDGEERDFAVQYKVLEDLSGDQPDGDALELFERFSDEIFEVAAEVAAGKPTASVVVIRTGDFE